MTGLPKGRGGAAVLQTTRSNRSNKTDTHSDWPSALRLQRRIKNHSEGNEIICENQHVDMCQTTSPTHGSFVSAGSEAAPPRPPPQPPLSPPCRLSVSLRATWVIITLPFCALLDSASSAEKRRLTALFFYSPLLPSVSRSVLCFCNTNACAGGFICRFSVGVRRSDRCAEMIWIVGGSGKTDFTFQPSGGVAALLQ